MNTFARIGLIIVSFLLAVFSMSFIVAVLFPGEVLSSAYTWLSEISIGVTSRFLLISFWSIVLMLCVAVMVYIALNGRLRSMRIRRNDSGAIDIGVDALESIALNAAKSAQGGIKSAKARVSQGSGGKIRISINTVLFSDVEVPAMMGKVQDRIKKDIERYTGIPVGQVIVKVSRVEPVAARIER